MQNGSRQADHTKHSFHLLTVAMSNPVHFMVPFQRTAHPRATQPCEGFTEGELRKIAERASTLRERLGSSFTSADADAQEDARYDARLKRWCERAAGGDWGLFEKRLAWDGLDLDQARRAVRPVRLKTPLPPWTQTLQDCVTEASAGQPILKARFFDDEEPLPFEHLIAHFVRVGQRRLMSKSAHGWRHVTDRALGCLERNLLRTLFALCAQALYVNFVVYRAIGFAEGKEAVNGSADASGAFARTNDADDAAYRAFSHTMCGPELRAFFLEYSVLARLMATSIEAWVVNSAQFLERLDADWNQLVRVYASGDPGPVTHVSHGLSDPHGGGATTHVLVFSTGLRLVYKPKNLGLCAAYQEFLAWCNEQGFEPAFQPMKVLTRPAYGWVEYIAAKACRSEAEARHFFQRSGALLCAVYALNGEDFHHENVIADGGQAILIDLEVLMCPLIDQALAPQRKRLVTDHRLTNTVLLTGLLPIWVRNATREKKPSFTNVGGLFGGTSQTFERFGWTAINTDRMSAGFKTVEKGRDDNLATLKGKTLNAADYLSNIIGGFEQMYELLRSNAEVLVEKEGPLSAFADQSGRFLFRTTGIYASMLRRLRHPNYLREGIDRDIELEALARGYVELAERPSYWPVVEAEIADLNRRDVPLFKLITTSRHLRSAEGEDLGACFQSSGYEVVRSKLMALDREDLALQRELIRASFYTLQVEDVHEGGKASDAGEQGQPQALTLTPDLAIEEARQIVEKLQRAGIKTDEGFMTWMSLVFDPASGHFRIREVGHNLHDGRCGLALFFTALASVTSEASELRALISTTLRPVIEHFTDGAPFETGAKWQKIGGTVGLGSFVYSLTRVGALLDDAAAIEAARIAASRITPDKIAADDDLDIVSGAAGAVLGLLALYRETGEAGTLETALQCGQHLLASRAVEPGSGLRAWRTLQGQFRTGFSHGAAGIAHALAELYCVTKEREFLAAALEAFAFERTLFVPDVENWYPYRAWSQETGRSPDALWSTWCHGATGIGLARAANLGLFTAEERGDLEAAVRTTKAYLFSGVDHVCCGDMGRICFMATAARALDRPALTDEEMEAARRLLARTYERGNFALTMDGRELLKPGFLQGLSGVGYTLLQITHPEGLPSVPLLR